jgi:hypothetical protein
MNSLSMRAGLQENVESDPTVSFVLIVKHSKKNAFSLRSSQLQVLAGAHWCSVVLILVLSGAHYSAPWCLSVVIGGSLRCSAVKAAGSILNLHLRYILPMRPRRASLTENRIFMHKEGNRPPG